MLIPIDEVTHFDVITSTPSTGAAVDGDSAPTFDVFEEDTDTPILAAQTMTKRTSKTGNYRGTFTASAANGFEAGKWYDVIASGVVGAVTGKCRAMHFRVAPAESSAGVPKGDVSHFGGTAGTFAAGIPETKVASIAANAITASAINADAITDAKVAADVTIASVTGAVGSVTGAVGSVTGAVGSVTGAVGSVTGNVGGNVVGTVASVVGAVGSVTGLTASDVGAIKAKTDNLPSDPADASDIAASHSSLSTAIGTRASQVSVDDLPTNAELATALGTADDATLAQVALVKAKTDLIPASPAAVGDIPTAVQIADAFLARDIGSGSGAGTLNERTVRAALRFNRNKFTISGGTLTVYREDDTTVAFTAAITTTAGNPVSASDPV